MKGKARVRSEDLQSPASPLEARRQELSQHSVPAWGCSQGVGKVAGLTWTKQGSWGDSSDSREGWRESSLWRGVQGPAFSGQRLDAPKSQPGVRTARTAGRPEAPRDPRAQARASKRTNCHPVSPRKEVTTKGQARQGCAVKAKATGSSETFKPRRHSGKWEGNLAREKLSSCLISLGWDARHSRWPLTVSVASLQSSQLSLPLRVKIQSTSFKTRRLMPVSIKKMS